MATELWLTIPEMRGSLERKYGKLVPDWKLRRVVDSLENLDVYRAGNYRLVSSDDVHIVADELRRLKWLPEVPEASPCELKRPGGNPARSVTSKVRTNAASDHPADRRAMDLPPRDGARPHQGRPTARHQHRQ